MSIYIEFHFDPGKIQLKWTANQLSVCSRLLVPLDDNEERQRQIVPANLLSRLGNTIVFCTGTEKSKMDRQFKKDDTSSEKMVTDSTNSKLKKAKHDTNNTSTALGLLYRQGIYFFKKK